MTETVSEHQPRRPCPQESELAIVVRRYRAFPNKKDTGTGGFRHRFSVAGAERGPVGGEDGGRGQQRAVRSWLSVGGKSGRFFYSTGETTTPSRRSYSEHDRTMKLRMGELVQPTHGNKYLRKQWQSSGKAHPAMIQLAVDRHFRQRVVQTIATDARFPRHSFG